MSFHVFLEKIQGDTPSRSSPGNLHNTSKAGNIFSAFPCSHKSQMIGFAKGFFCKHLSKGAPMAAEGIASVNNNVAQSSIVAGEIGRDINEVSRLAANPRQCSERVEVGSQRLNNVVIELQNETGKFKLNVPPGQTKKSA